MLQCPYCARQKKIKDLDVILNDDEGVLTTSKGTIKIPGRIKTRLFTFLYIRNECVSFGEIYDHVFRYNNDTCEVVLRVHISTLRKLIEKVGLTIQSKRGYGYFLKPCDGD